MGTTDEWATRNVLDEVATERRVQRGRWGNVHDDHHDEAGWSLVLGTYVGGALREALDLWIPRPSDEAKMRYLAGSHAGLRSFLVKVTTIAVAWVEAIDRAETKEKGGSQP